MWKKVGVDMEIEVGEYVRTKNGTIGKFKFYGKNDTSLIYFKTKYRLICVDDTEIVKHSKDIIDLIEVGDYVNDYKVINVINGECCPSGKCVDIDSSMQSSECTFWESDIKSIVTKEQFESIKYEVE